jgi:hypothetical protein
VLPTQYFSVDKIENNELGGVCNAHGARRGVYRVLVGKLGERSHLGDHGVDRRIIIRWIFRK